MTIDRQVLQGPQAVVSGAQDRRWQGTAQIGNYVLPLDIEQFEHMLRRNREATSLLFFIQERPAT